MKTMHWLGVITTTLISLNVLTGCSGDDAPAAPGSTAGAPSTGGSGGSGTAGTGTGGTGDNVGMQLRGPAAYTILTTAEAPVGASAPPAFSGANICSTCHGANGQGVDQLAPELRSMPVDYFKQVVRNGRKDVDGKDTGMAAFTADKLPDADLEAMATWAAGLPKPTDGKGLYRSMCGNCHGPMNPTGGGSPIKIQGASLANVDKFVRMGNGTDFNNRKEYMPKYDTTLLSETELTAIKTFIGAK